MRQKTLRERVETRIARKKDNVFLTREFSDLGGEDQVIRALRALVRDGQLIKLGYGVYGRAFPSRLSGKRLLYNPSGFVGAAREALTKVLVEATGNMIKHGDPAGPASILIEGDLDEVEAVFINRPRRAGSPRASSARLGLVGARERVEALGGEVDVTSESPDWVVRVRIPLGG